MRSVIALLSLAALMFVGAADTARSADDKSGFFNGKDLEGWEGLKEYWTVKDGEIIGSSLPKGINFNTFLCSKKKYKDFEMSCMVRLKEAKGNSGMQIRSKLIEDKKFATDGEVEQIISRVMG